MDFPRETSQSTSHRNHSTDFHRQPTVGSREWSCFLSYKMYTHWLYKSENTWKIVHIAPLNWTKTVCFCSVHPICNVIITIIKYQKTVFVQMNQKTVKTLWNKFWNASLRMKVQIICSVLFFRIYYFIYYFIKYLNDFHHLFCYFLSQPIWRPSKTCWLAKMFVSITIHGKIIIFVILKYLCSIVW